MKKKVLSVLLATALFAGSAVAVNAATYGDWDVSSQAGTDEDITKLEFDAASYTIKNGESKDMNEVLTAYAGTKAIVQEPTLEWTISDNDLIFGLETEDNKAKVYAYESKGTAVVTVTANEGKVKASCKIVAAPFTKATGFKFEKTSYKLPGVGAYDTTFDVKLVPTPSGAKFSKDQLKFFNDNKGNLTLELEDTKTAGATSHTANYADEDAVADDGIKFTFKGVDGYSTFTTGKMTVMLSGSEKFDFPAYDSDKKPKAMNNVNVRANVEAGKPAVRVGRTGTITIEVGQTIKAPDFIKYGPSDANNAKDVTNWRIEYYNDAATVDDYAVINGDGKILGVAVGKVKAVADFTNQTKSPQETTSVEIPINVVAKGSVAKNDMELSATSGTLAVGGTTWIEFKNAPSDPENITWTVDNDVVTIVPATGAGIKVFAKKTGTAKVTATYGDQTFEFTVTVNAKDAVAPVPTPGDDTVNPPTGDSLFANLF